MARKRFKFYVGFWSSTSARGYVGCNWFAADASLKIDAATYPGGYDRIVGPFKTKRGAVYFSENPSTRDIETAERCAKMLANAQKYPG